MELFELLKALIDIPSPSGKEHIISDFLEDFLKDMGLEIYLQDVGSGRKNIFAYKGEPLIVLSTHTDVVSPHIGYSEDDEFIYGRGACDAKGVLACQIKSIERLIEAGEDDIGLLFVVGEEYGSDGARKAAEIPNRCVYLICGEPTENRLASCTKGALRFELIARGRAAHSAYPEEGDSAIEKLINICHDLLKLRLPSEDRFGLTTLNIGVVKGGTHSNVIPALAKAEVMIRTATDSNSIKRCIESVVKDRAEIEYHFETEPVSLMTMPGFEHAKMSYTTDIPLLKNWGLPLLIGPGSPLSAHSDNERVSKDQLKKGVELYTRLIMELKSLA